MKTFLKEIVEHVYKDHNSFEKCVFVLPSKRAGLFLKRHITSFLSQPIFSPKIYSIEELVGEISGLEKSSNLELLLDLYESFKPQPDKEELTFESFIPWGQTLLSDFNEIDRNLITPSSLFNYLIANQRLKNWGVDNRATPLIQSTLKFWSQLPNVYQSFQKKLLKRGLAYQGLQYKESVSKVKDYIANSEKTYHFIGFNALNKAEEQIIQSFQSEGNSKVWWDIDAYFINDPVHEAGLFIRDYHKKWLKSNVLLNLEHSFVEEKNIEIIGVPKFISQAKYTGHILKKLYARGTSLEQNIALVLGDETLLKPILGSLPDDISKVNITMGLPLSKTTLFEFFNSLLHLHINKSNKGWFHKDVSPFLSNPYSILLSNSSEKKHGIHFNEYLKEKNVLFINHSVLQRKPFRDSPFLQQVFHEKDVSSLKFVKTCQNIIQSLKAQYETSDNQLELHYLYGFYQLFNQLENLISAKSYLQTIKAIKPLFNELVSNEQLDFKGEPFGGLQIMGVLESRNLDFDTVIITSVNEGILPAGKNQNSFIPYDIKKEFGLPTYKEKDAIYSYHFYRLLQRAKNIYILYNTEPDVLMGNEKSRFISQLLTDGNISHNIKHHIAAPTIEVNAIPPKSIQKTPALLKLLKERAIQGFSPSSLTNYIKNPYGFYRTNILGLMDIKEVEENIAHNTFGTIVHDVLETLYLPLIGQRLSPEILNGLIKDVEKVTQIKFEEHYLPKDINSGQNVIAFHVIQKYVTSFIKLDISRSQSHDIMLLALEENLKTPIHLPGNPAPVMLKGKLDRLERIDGIPNILDYKTGIVSRSEVEITNIEDITTEKNLKAFQLLCYGLMKQKEVTSTGLLAGIVPIKSLDSGILSFAKKDGLRGPKNHVIDETLLSDFERQLTQLIAEILDPKIPFKESESGAF